MSSQYQTNDNNQRIAKNTLLLYFRMFLTMAVALYTSRVVLNVLGVEDFGIHNVVGGVVAMMAFFNSSMTTSTQRFLNVEMGKGDNENLDRIFVNAVKAHFIIAVITLVLIEIVGIWLLYYKLNIPADRFNAALWVFHISTASLFVSIISTPYNAAIIAHERMSVYAYFSILDVSLKLGVVYLLIISPIDKLIAYAILLFCVVLVMQTCYILYCRRHFEECRCWGKSDGALMKNMFSFTSWMIFGCLADMLGNQGVNLLVNMFFGPIYNAARGISVQVKTAVDSFVMNFLTAVKPQILKAYSAGEWDYMYKLVFSSSRISYYLLLLLSLPILFNTHYILTIWLKTVPPYCELFTQLTLVELLIRTIYTPIAQVNQASGRIRNYQIAISLLFLLTFVLSYVIYKLGYPVYSCFIVAIIVAVLGLFVRLVILRRDNDFPVEDFLKQVIGPIIPVTIVCLLFPSIYQYFQSNESLGTFIISTIICVLSTTAIVWLFGLNMSEKKVVLEKMKTLIHRS